MSMSDPLGDMLTRIRNGQHASKGSILCPSSRLRVRVLDVLKGEGFIRGYKEDKDERGLPVVRIDLKYDQGRPVIRELKRVSTPGRRVYSKVGDMPRIRNGLGVAIVSTPKGVLSDARAREENVGGEVLCQVF